MLQILVLPILPQTGKNEFSVCVANGILNNVCKEVKVLVLPVETNEIRSDNRCWSDNVHLSDFGLERYVINIEIAFRDLLDGFDASWSKFFLFVLHFLFVESYFVLDVCIPASPQFLHVRMGRCLEKYYLFCNTAFLSLFTIKFVRYMYIRQHTL